MPLENLLTLIEKLRERIDSHGDALRQSEALTRYALIDPLLRELGWDTGDPDVVVPEYSSDAGRVDYALRNNGKPIIMLEAKRLYKPLKDAVRQVINYCIQEGTDYFAVTDGRRWEIYETHKRGSIDEKRIISFDLKNPSIVDVCLKALALWRSAVVSDQIVAGQGPIVSLTTEQLNTTEPQLVEESTDQSKPSFTDEVWQTLSEFNPESNTQPPTEIMFPDGSRTSLKYQYNMLTEVMRWLMENGHLSESQCPIRWERFTEHLLVDTKPMQSAGGKEAKSGVKPVGSLYIDTWGYFKYKAENARTIIKQVGQDPAQFKVRLP